MWAANVLKLVRGRAIARYRDNMIYGQPLLIALLIWFTLVVMRLSTGPLPPEWALVCMVGPIGLLPLCVQASRSQGEASHRLLPALMRMALLLIAIFSAYAAWLWLTPRHD